MPRPRAPLLLGLLLPGLLLLLSAPRLPAESSPYPVLPPPPLTARIKTVLMPSLGSVVLVAASDGGTPPCTYRWLCKPVAPGETGLFPFAYQFEINGPPQGDNAVLPATPPAPGACTAWRVVATDSKGVKAGSLTPFILYTPSDKVSAIPPSGGDPTADNYDPGGEDSLAGTLLTPLPVGSADLKVTK